MDITELAINRTTTVKEALVCLNNTGLGILFVIDQDSKLIATLTDGDIRRALLIDYNIDSHVEVAMNSNFVSFNIDTEKSVILEKLSQSLKIIPITNHENKLVDFASINKIKKISVAEPLLTGNELLYVADCLKTNWISSQGKYVLEFEKLFEDYHNGMKSLAVSNGTVALHLALLSLGIGLGDEVIVPNLTFAASVNAILYTGATPILVDVDLETWNIDFTKIESKINSRTKAIMPVHLYGHPCEMSKIYEIAKNYNLKIIEDCAEALGSYYENNPVGTFADVATFSFYGNKTITTGEGGMLIFKDSKTREYASVLRDHGMEKNRRYWHSHVGYNYRLTNIQAAIGVAQFEKLQEFVSAKRKIAEMYNSFLSKYEYFQIPAEKNNCHSSYWLYTFLIVEAAPFKREELMNYLNNLGVETRPVFFPINIMPPYLQYGKHEELLVSNQISNSGMSLPSSANLTQDEILYICNGVESFIKKYI